MESRLATLLGDATLAPDRPLDPISLPSITPRRPLPVEPSPVGDDGRSNNPKRRSEYECLVAEYFSSTHWSAPPALQTRAKSGVPIAEVLNNEEEQPRADHATALAAAARFSGRLSDILLDPSKQDPSQYQQHPNKKQKVDEGNENNPLKLPKLPQLPKKATRRPRIPPLLQGLHQPPPLPPEGRLFPPITGEARGFGGNIGERVGLRTPPEEKGRRDRERESGGGGGSSCGVGSNGTRAETEQDKTKKAETTHTNDKENQGQGGGEHIVEKEIAIAKKNRKRNKWSEHETKDLLHGVKKLGIGNWKKILECPDFCFNQRTAVDLKDRFRTCCPGDGLKARKPKSKVDDVEEATPEREKEKETPLTFERSSGKESSQDNPPTATLVLKQKQPRKARVDTHKKTQAELAEMGIEGSFFKNPRRERRTFTDEDDQNLLKGFEKYRATWHAIRDDKDLGFISRHPTDLRDRFRIRYPRIYQDAGFKLKPKEKLLFPKEKHKAETDSQESSVSAIGTQKTDTQIDAPDTTSSDTVTILPTTTTPTAPTSNLRAHALPHALPHALLNSFPASLEDFPSPSEDDDDLDGRHSPITLNRNIFQWADANPSHTSSAVAGGYLTTGDAGFNVFAGMDGYHINPLATLKLPAASIRDGGMAGSGMGSYAPASNPLAMVFPSRETVHTGVNMGMNVMNMNMSMSITTAPTAPQSFAAPSTSTPTPASTSTSASNKQPNSLLHTPNLPTIVFPHVPVASARNAMHNLPPPADLLSGLDLDMRAGVESQQQQQYTGFPGDEGLGFGIQSSGGSGGGGGYASSSTLAPLIGQGGPGRGRDEGFGERRAF